MPGFGRGEEEGDIVRRASRYGLGSRSNRTVERAATRLGVSRHSFIENRQGMGRFGGDVEDLTGDVGFEVARIFLREGLQLIWTSKFWMRYRCRRSGSIPGSPAKIRVEGFDPKLTMRLNTGGMISLSRSSVQLVRPRIALYGYHLPFEKRGREVSGRGLASGKPVLTGKTRIPALREARA